MEVARQLRELELRAENMQINEVKFRVTYFEKTRQQFGKVITSDPEDGASLLFEPLDDNGDVMGGDIYRTEACFLYPPTENGWNKVFTGPDAIPFSDMNECDTKCGSLIVVSENELLPASVTGYCRICDRPVVLSPRQSLMANGTELCCLRCYHELLAGHELTDDGFLFACR